MKKNGFVSTALIYAFFIIFLLLMIFLLNSYSTTRFLLEQYKNDIKNDFVDVTGADINLYYMIYNVASEEYDIEKEVPDGFAFEENKSYCVNGSTINYTNNEIVLSEIKGRESCYVYFKEDNDSNIIRIYTKETADGNKYLVRNVLNADIDYEIIKQDCVDNSGNVVNNVVLNYDATTGKYFIDSNPSNKRVVCTIELLRKNTLIINYYLQNNDGNYIPSVSIPSSGYTYNSEKSSCINAASINVTDNFEITIEPNTSNTCNVYFDISEATNETE